MTDIPTISPPRNPIALLRRFARPPAPQERCDLCAAPLAEQHEHLLEPDTRQLHCACQPCAILFSNTQNGRYRRVPQRLEHWSDFLLSDDQWHALGVPIALAFFFRSSPQDQIVTLYPSPGGATESTLPGEVWQLLCEDNPPLVRLEPDVEALLVNRLRGARDYYRVPIDECFKLVGLIRSQWRGLSGGKELWQEVDQFFQRLTARCAGAGTHA